MVVILIGNNKRQIILIAPKKTNKMFSNCRKVIESIRVRILTLIEVQTLRLFSWKHRGGGQG